MSLKKQIAAFITTFGAMLAGVAFAAWTATGTGNGYAKAQTASNLTFDDISATVAATLYPGVSGANYQYQIHNPNNYPVTVTNVASNSAVTPDAGHPGCTQANSGVSYTAPGSVSISIPALSSSALQTVPSASMSNSSVDACQGAVFGLSFTATGQSG
jgi:hypothetical protein